jgi:hypothetical protein
VIRDHWVNISLSILMVISTIYNVVKMRREARQRREYYAICEDVVAGRIKEALVKARAYSKRWT